MNTLISYIGAEETGSAAVLVPQTDYRAFY